MEFSFPLLLLFFLFLLLIYEVSSSQTPPRHEVSEKIKICEKPNKTQLLNYLGTSLISNSGDPKDLVLCPGDAFGDLNETYVLLKDCYLTMYHKYKMIWFSKINPYWRFLQQKEDDNGEICALSLKRDGGLMLQKETWIYPFPGNAYKSPQYLWDSQTNFHSDKTELMVKGQQVQIVQTFKDGSQRLFYADENHQEFVEDLGTPIKIADKFIIKSHQDEDKTILHRNEYIGDLDGVHLILQTNCQLQLLDKNKTIWSFSTRFRHEMSCTLNVAGDNTIEISSNDRESVIKSDANLEVISSRITFEDDQPVIIQTLKNGSELIFCGGPSRNVVLSLKREPTQISQKVFPLLDNFDYPENYDTTDTDDDSDEDEGDTWTIRRMDYIGNLTGLHLILQQNCSLILANGNKKLWEFQSEPSSYDAPVMDCLVQLDSSGDMELKRRLTSGSRWEQRLLERPFSYGRERSIWVQLTLENDQIILRRGHSSRGPDTFYAGPKTNGTFFWFLGESSVVVKAKEYFNEILPKMGFIGDLNGVYTILDKHCNWVLYNKTQVLWESGSSMSYAWNRCALVMRGNREIKILAQQHGEPKKTLWSGVDPTPKDVLKIELLLEDGELWLIQTFREGIVHKYKAIKGTNNFALVSKKHDESFGLEL